MKLTALALAAAVSSVSSATFVSYVVVKTQTANSGINLDVYNVYARFDGATDTLLNCFNFNRTDANETNMFYHKDLNSTNSNVLSKSYGTWAPTATGNALNNRPYDSFLLIGGNPVATNTTNADPSWGGAGWSRPDIPNGVNAGWFNSSPPNNQGRVGIAPNTATDVRIGQFVVDRDAFGGTWNLKIGYNNGVPGSQVQFAETSFTLGVPAPGAIALLGLAGLAGRRRR
jgi:hypothetical protein